MPSTLIGHYNVDYSAVALPEQDGWAAHLAIYGPSANPMHRNTVFPEQRVAVEMAFATSEEAEAAALHIAQEMLHTHKSDPPHG